MSKVRFLGLDVHADTIAVAVAEPNGEARSIGAFPNRLESIRKFVHKLGPANQLRACYEAGPTGYALYWQLAALGVACEVDQGWGSSQDRPPGCGEAGTLLSCR